MGAVFKLKNNDSRSYGFAGRLCIAGSGCPTPAKAAEQVINGVPFRLPPLFELTEEEMFRSYRGVVATMNTMTRIGHPTLEIFVDGVTTPLTAKEMEEWAADYRARTNRAEPRNHAEKTHETEKAMARPEDPIERVQRLSKQEEQSTLVQTITAAVLAVLQRQAPPAASVSHTRGRNDEKSEEPTAPTAQRARPRPE